MKLILKIFLLIIGVGLLISCANNIDLSKIFNEDKTTHSNTNNTTHVNHSTTQVNTTTINEPDVYLHSIRIFFDGNDYNININDFDFTIEIESTSSNEINTYELLENYYYVNGDQQFRATGTVDLVSIGEVNTINFAYESHVFYISYSKFDQWYGWKVEYVSLLSDSYSFNIIDTVSLVD